MKKIESGRSMVEMLGVLAIIGVLSVGGIAGYTMAMNKYKANNIVAAANQCGILAATMNQGTGPTGATIACADLGVDKPTDVVAASFLYTKSTKKVGTGIATNTSLGKAIMGITGDSTSTDVTISFN